MKKVIVNIERLALAGFRNTDRLVIARELERELEHIFASRKVLSPLNAHSRDIPQMKVRNVDVPVGSKSQSIGETVARAINKELSK